MDTGHRLLLRADSGAVPSRRRWRAGAVGWSEWRLGTRRVAIAAVEAQLVGVLGASLFLVAFRGTGWEWAQRLAETLDVGFSAGALGAVAAASATVSPPWRGRIRLLLVGFATIALLYIGLLWDLEHFFAVVFGLALGPVLLGRRPRFGPIRLSRHEWRIIASVSFVLIAVVNVLLSTSFPRTDHSEPRAPTPTRSAS